jgi:hypothetical protein
MGMTLEQLAEGEGRETNPFLEKFKFSKIWGNLVRERLDTGARDPQQIIMEPPMVVG